MNNKNDINKQDEDNYNSKKQKINEINDNLIGEKENNDKIKENLNKKIDDDIIKQNNCLYNENKNLKEKLKRISFYFRKGWTINVNYYFIQGWKNTLFINMKI